MSNPWRIATLHHTDQPYYVIYHLIDPDGEDVTCNWDYAFGSGTHSRKAAEAMLEIINSKGEQK